MQKSLVITILVFTCFFMCSCTKGNLSVHSANSAKLKKLRSEYKAKSDAINRQAENRNYSYEQDVLKIDLR